MSAPYVVIIRTDLHTKQFWNESDLRNALVDLAARSVPVLVLRFHATFGCYATMEVSE